MMNVSPSQLAGMWLSPNGDNSMFISIETNRVEVCCNRVLAISEPLVFSYNHERNICKISDSVLLYQLFDEDEILIRVALNEQVADFIFRRRI